jgi:hypothetical protein
MASDTMNFGAPKYDEPEVHSADPLDQVQDVLDPNDPRLVSEPLDVNVDADAYAFPAPPPDAKYRAKLKLVPQEDPQTKEKKNYKTTLWGKNKKAVAVAVVEADIIDPSGKYDGIKVFDYNVSTFLTRENATKVATILARLKRPDGSPWVGKTERLSVKEWGERLVKALAGEPEIGIETVWEYQCQGCAKEAKDKGTDYPRRITGMHKFPPSRTKAGEYDPEMRCQVNPAHGFSRARVQIGRFLHLSELK